MARGNRSKALRDSVIDELQRAVEHKWLRRAIWFVNAPIETLSPHRVLRTLGVLPQGSGYIINRSGTIRAAKRVYRRGTVRVVKAVHASAAELHKFQRELVDALESIRHGEELDRPVISHGGRIIGANVRRASPDIWARVYIDEDHHGIAAGSIVIPTINGFVAYAKMLFAGRWRTWLRRCQNCGVFFLRKPAPQHPPKYCGKCQGVDRTRNLRARAYRKRKRQQTTG
jgi:hypothetical protein